MRLTGSWELQVRNKKTKKGGSYASKASRIGVNNRRFGADRPAGMASDRSVTHGQHGHGTSHRGASNRFRNSRNGNNNCALRQWGHRGHQSGTGCRSGHGERRVFTHCGCHNSSTYSYANEVDSEAALGDLNLTVGAVRITADSVLAEASQVLGAPSSGRSYIDNLAINGVPIVVTGAPNQTIPIPGGQVVCNEQTTSQDGTTVVNALHITVNGTADVVISTARVGIS